MSYNSDIDKLNRTTETLSSVIRNLKTYQQPEVINVSTEMKQCRKKIIETRNSLEDLIYAIDILETALMDEGIQTD
tara:strand:+ start:3133 stop:3360 length:228 start_codon:yes stop_codon:yes gene_type:complete